jgi:hypothetical protein
MVFPAKRTPQLLVRLEMAELKMRCFCSPACACVSGDVRRIRLFARCAVAYADFTVFAHRGTVEPYWPTAVDLLPAKGDRSLATCGRWRHIVPATQPLHALESELGIRSLSRQVVLVTPFQRNEPEGRALRFTDYLII